MVAVAVGDVEHQDQHEMTPIELDAQICVQETTPVGGRNGDFDLSTRWSDWVASHNLDTSSTSRTRARIYLTNTSYQHT